MQTDSRIPVTRDWPVRRSVNVSFSNIIHYCWTYSWLSLISNNFFLSTNISFHPPQTFSGPKIQISPLLYYTIFFFFTTLTWSSFRLSLNTSSFCTIFTMMMQSMILYTTSLSSLVTRFSFRLTIHYKLSSQGYCTPGSNHSSTFLHYPFCT